MAELVSLLNAQLSGRWDRGKGWTAGRLKGVDLVRAGSPPAGGRILKTTDPATSRTSPRRHFS